MPVSSLAVAKRALGTGSQPLPPTIDCFEGLIGLITTSAGFIGIINTDPTGTQSNLTPEMLLQGHIDPTGLAFDNELCGC